MPPRRTIVRGIVAALLTLAGTNAYAETFPTKPVRILVPYAAGGAVDVLARTLAQSLSKSWGQQPVIENRPGAGGTIASQALTQSAPDGYTLILVASGHPLNQFFYPKLPYDTFKDFYRDQRDRLFAARICRVQDQSGEKSRRVAGERARET